MPKLLLSLPSLNGFQCFRFSYVFRIFPLCLGITQSFSWHNSYNSNTDSFFFLSLAVGHCLQMLAWDSGYLFLLHPYNLPALNDITGYLLVSFPPKKKKCLKSTLWQGYDTPLIPATLSSTPLKVIMDAFHFCADSPYITATWLAPTAFDDLREKKKWVCWIRKWLSV